MTPPLPSQLRVVATRPTVVMEAMAEAAMEGAAMATSREAGAMEGAAMARTEGAVVTVVMEVVGDMVATEGVAMEAMAVEEVQDVMMTVSVLAWVLACVEAKHLSGSGRLSSFSLLLSLAAAGYGGSRYGGPVRSQYQTSYHPHPYNRN